MIESSKVACPFNGDVADRNILLRNFDNQVLQNEQSQKAVDLNTIKNRTDTHRCVAWPSSQVKTYILSGIWSLGSLSVENKKSNEVN